MRVPRGAIEPGRLGKERHRGGNKVGSHGLLEAFLVHGHLDCDVWELRIHLCVYGRFDGRVVSGVFVVLGHGSNAREHHKRRSDD